MALNRVAVLEGGRTLEMSVGEFLAMPLDRRVRLVLEQQLQFYDEAGRRLSTADGLKLLRGAREEAGPLPAER
jgi:hypothetical protein